MASDGRRRGKGQGRQRRERRERQASRAAFGIEPQGFVMLGVPEAWSRAEEAAAWRWLSNAARKEAGAGVIRSRLNAGGTLLAERVVVVRADVWAAWKAALERRASEYGYVRVHAQEPR